MGTSWPVEIRVGVTYRETAVRGGGVFSISPEALTVRPDGISQELLGGVATTVKHDKTSIRLLKTKLAPPWCNRSFVVEGVGGPILATMPFFLAARAEAAIVSAGFSVAEESTWISGWLSRRALWDEPKSPSA